VCGDLPDRNLSFADAFISELGRSGVHHACICPGSRSTPLVLSLARSHHIKTWVHLDERSAAYFALGISRAIHEPVAVVCTSGTAAANVYPAIVEAHYSHIPLLVLTADRPPELWEWGANQTIDQNRMYGQHVKWAVNMATPEPTPELLRFVHETSCRAVATAVESRPGPVQINVPFREPLVPDTIPSVFEEVGERRTGAYTTVNIGRVRLDHEQLRRMAHALEGKDRGIIICGPQDDPEFAPSVAALAKLLRFPILADPLSQVRCGTHDRSNVIDCYDGFLRSQKLTQALRPEVILRFGATPTSKSLLRYLAQIPDAYQICIHPSDWQDQDHMASEMIHADPTQFVNDLARTLTPSVSSKWLEEWSIIAERSRTAIVHYLNKIEEIFEGKVFSELAELLLAKATLFAGNSMPVRDLDAFYPGSPHEIRFLANRGASGIDGVLSTALGIAAVTQCPLVTVLGDLSFYHDMNGLLSAQKFKPNATIIVLNNNGGGIFSFLPQHNHPEYFETYFATPHNLTFEAAATLYRLHYTKVRSWDEFRKTISQNITIPGTKIVELNTERERNIELHHQISSAVTVAADKVISGEI